MPTLTANLLNTSIPIESTPYAPVVMWFLITGCTWEEALLQGGFNPADKIVIKEVQDHWKRNEKWYKEVVSEQSQGALARVAPDSAVVINAIAHNQNKWSRVLVRPTAEWFDDKGILIADDETIQKALAIDQAIVDHLTKSSIAMGLLGAGEKPVSTTAARLQ